MNTYKLLMAVIRILAILTAILFFGWYNIFNYLVPKDVPRTADIIWIQAGIIYCVGTLLTALNLDFKEIVRKIYLLYNFGIALIIGFDLFFSYFFGQTWLMLVDLALLGVVIGNGWLVFEKKAVFEKSRWTTGVVIIIGLIGVGILSSKWNYFAEKITCEGAIMTTTGSYERWSHSMPRLHCYSSQLLDN